MYVNSVNSENSAKHPSSGQKLVLTRIVLSRYALPCGKISYLSRKMKNLQGNSVGNLQYQRSPIIKPAFNFLQTKTHIGAVLCIFKIRQEKSHRVETIPIDRSIEDKIL